MRRLDEVGFAARTSFGKLDESAFQSGHHCGLITPQSCPRRPSVPRLSHGTLTNKAFCSLNNAREWELLIEDPLIFIQESIHIFDPENSPKRTARKGY